MVSSLKFSDSGPDCIHELDANLRTKDAKEPISGIESNRATGFDAIPDEARWVVTAKGEGTEILIYCLKY
jgi:hypothetical protein